MRQDHSAPRELNQTHIARTLARRLKEFRETLSSEERKVLATWLGSARSIFPLPILPLQVIYPAPYPAGVEDFSNDAPGHLIVTVEFIGFVEILSVVPKRTCIISTSVDPNADGHIKEVKPTQGGNSAFTFTTKKTFDELLFQGPDATFNLTLVGTSIGLGTILDKSGNALDGDGDFVPGGNFTTTFARIG